LAWLSTAINNKYQENKEKTKRYVAENSKKLAEQDEKRFSATSIDDYIAELNKPLVDTDKTSKYVIEKHQLNKQDYVFAIENWLIPKGNTINFIGDPARLSKNTKIISVEVMYTNQQNKKKLCFFMFDENKAFIKIIEYPG